MTREELEVPAGDSFALSLEVGGRYRRPVLTSSPSSSAFWLPRQAGPGLGFGPNTDDNAPPSLCAMFFFVFEPVGVVFLVDPVGKKKNKKRGENTRGFSYMETWTGNGHAGETMTMI